MRYYLIAGEASGDLHGSNLMKELKAVDPNAKFRYFGGDLMQGVSPGLVKHYREMAYMGIIDVVLNIKTIKRNMEICKKDLLEFHPDVLILIDYPGFNLRIAEFAKQNNIRVHYYISPKLWAWKEYRVKKIKAYVDEMFTIFPFETEFYQKHDYEVNYVGNPLMDSLSEFEKNAQKKESFYQDNGLNNKPIVAILSGSRIKEIKRILPVMLQASEGENSFQFVVAGVKSVSQKVYDEIIGDRKVAVVYDQTYDLLNNAYAALVASGTASLETALFNVPQTVLYRVEGGWLVDFIMRHMVLKTKWVSLPNIILGKAAVKELLQKDMTLKMVKTELNKLLYDYNYRGEMVKDYNQIKREMGVSGCSRRAAEKIVQAIKR